MVLNVNKNAVKSYALLKNENKKRIEPISRYEISAEISVEEASSRNDQLPKDFSLLKRNEIPKG